MKVPLYYRGPCALITHDVYEVRAPVRETFPIRDLRSIQIIQPDKPPSTTGVALFRILNVLLALSAVVVSALAWRQIDSSEVVVIALLVTTASSVISAGCWRVPVQPFELVATFRGREICLLRTTDQRELGQVSRALIRAIEQNAYHR
jgi:Family of unknown function (DUF6232)